MKRLLPFLLIFLLFPLSAQLPKKTQFSGNPFIPKEIKNFFKFYPDIKYTAVFDNLVFDWEIDMSADLFYERTNKPKGKKSTTLYWADGRLLPKKELPNKEKYWVLQYKYENKLRDPKTFTHEEIEQIRNFSSQQNRKNSGGTPMFFFDFLYSAKSKRIIEDHIIPTTFLGKKTRVHERIYDPLKRVEKKILAQKGNPEIKSFLFTLRSADAYHWREIAETTRKSFHSYGIAIDLLPSRLKGRAIYWGWEKERSGDSWMLVPLEKRWMPPAEVRNIFESEGFIWGGYWVIFDNMHFEYHPELISR